MAFGDHSFKIAKTASVVYATTALSQALLLTDNSLSANHNAKEVFYVDVQILNANTFKIAPSTLGGNLGGAGYTVYSGSVIHLKPMTVDNIKNLAAWNSAASANASAQYVFWRRLPA